MPVSLISALGCATRRTHVGHRGRQANVVAARLCSVYAAFQERQKADTDFIDALRVAAHRPTAPHAARAMMMAILISLFRGGVYAYSASAHARVGFMRTARHIVLISLRSDASALLGESHGRRITAILESRRRLAMTTPRCWCARVAGRSLSQYIYYGGCFMVSISASSRYGYLLFSHVSMRLTALSGRCGSMALPKHAKI